MEEKFKKYYPFPLHVDEIIPFKTMCNGKGLDMAYDVVWAKFERPVYEELVDIINGVKEYNDSPIWSTPTKYIAKGCEIYSEGKEYPIIRVRGWGKLTGVGGFKLSTDEAVKIQDEFVNYILTKLNNKKEV